jgi:hypothetical protein
MIGLLLAAALSTYPDLPAYDFFRAEVARQATRLSMRVPAVELVAPLDRPDRWAWVGQCPFKIVDGVAYVTACDPVIYVRRDVLQYLGLDALSMVALHEVLHVWLGAHLSPIWTLDDPYSLREREREHSRIEREVIDGFDRATRAAAARQIRRWSARWLR